MNTARPDWQPGQVTVDATSDFRLIMEGKASNGGFAIDQLIFSPGKCESELQFLFHRKRVLIWFKSISARPREAVPTRENTASKK